jgi:hypothetical protein
MIDSYGFGKMVINKVLYEKDVIVFPDHVQPNWWRKEGHLLQRDDLREVVETYKPETVVIGRGKFGMMKVDDTYRNELEKSGIRLHAENTDKAVKMFNRLLLAGSRVLGAFHLTC